jgi:hypothetical protein
MVSIISNQTGHQMSIVQHENKDYSELVALNGLNKEQWLNLEKESLDTYNIHQTYEWALANDVANPAEKPLFSVFYDGNEMVGGIQWQERRNPIGRSLIAHSGPICLPGYHEKLRPMLANHIVSLRKHYPLIFLNACRSSNLKLDEYGLHKLSKYETSVIDLNWHNPMEQIWKDFSQGVRWSIRQGTKNSLSVRIETEWNEWEKSFEILEKRYYEKNIVKTVNYKLFEKLYEIMRPSGKLKVFCCYLGEKMIGTLWLSILRNHALYYREGALEQYRKKQPGSFLLWNSLCWAKDHAMKEFDLGELPPIGSAYSSIRKFRIGWGGKVEFRERYMENSLFRTTYKVIVDNPPVNRSLNSLLMKLPASVKSAFARVSWPMNL